MRLQARIVMAMCLLLLQSAILLAQDKRTVSGNVKGAGDAPLEGVSVTEKGTSNRTITNNKGAFEIRVSPKATIVFSYIGYANQEVSANAPAEAFEISLKEGNAGLNEVVVTALGISKDAKKLGYQVQKVNATDLMKTAPPNLSQGLMGKVAGLNVTVPNGVEGSSQRVVIRGNNVLFGNNQPLFVVDGVQLSDGQMGTKQSNGSGFDVKTASFGTPDLGGTQTDWGSPLNFINSEDIEEINVLKGPTAAALYGARGANGVVLITTKKGSKKGGLGIEYSLSSRYTTPYLFQKYQDQYGSGGAIALWTADESQKLPKDADGNLRYPAEAPWSGAGVSDKFTQFGPLPGGKNYWDYFSWPGAGLSWGAKMTGQPVVWWDGVTRPYKADPSAAKSFFNTGNTTSQNLAFSTGGDFGSMRASLNRTTNSSIIPNSGFNQTSVNIGSNLNISKKLKAETVVTYTKYNRKNTPSLGDNNSISKFLTYGFPADYTQIEKNVYKNADGSKNKFDNAMYPLSYPYSSYSNMWWHIYEENTTLDRDQLIGSLKLSADVTPWLNVMGRAGLDYADNKFETKNTPIDAQGYQGSYGLEMNKNNTFTGEFLATAHKSKLFSVLDAGLSVGTSTWYNKFEGSTATNKGPFANPYLYYLNNTTATVNNSWLPEYYRLESKINSVYGLMNLSYKNYLFLELTGRNDWSSTLPISNASYFYPAASLSYVFTEHLNLGSAASWLDFGKVRFAYAGSANGTTPYNTTALYNSGTFGGVVTRYLESNLRPINLEPQRSKSIEFGTQLSFLQNRLSVDFTYYKIKSTSQILSAPLAVSSGFSNKTFNTGALENNGIEFIVKGTPIRTKDFEWNISLNGAHNSNKVLALSEGIDKYYLGTVFGSRTGAVMYAKVGDQFGTIYGLDYQYKNGQKVVRRLMDNTGTQVVGTQYVTTPDVVAIGNATPWLTGGLGNVFKYRNLSLFVLTDFKLGGDIYSFDYASAMGEGKAPETVVERNGGGLPYVYPDGSKANHGVILDGVFEDGTKNTDVVNYMFKYAGQYAAWSNVDMPRSNAVFENSWIKCREVSLTYDLPAKITRGSKFLQGMSVSIIGRDLFYFYKTLPDNLNPEGVSGTGNIQGFQWASLPGTRSVGFSVRVKL
ncbi:SusC/RagA family TonB-linked outer membrane protein [Danxiaibacter flavus]|uniref:SusC/RagA family TonB-linked outer membrane protein n=1 Tax=Danxiaibacter flavus TaxID=3049108 RepID=A0ABV3ZF49_9BACT|nr:SusC/RagA family TonB-linked outer membrane protein [Chitinophagaceae bacterium DXS]